jgi:hypothetical protein
VGVRIKWVRAGRRMRVAADAAKAAGVGRVVSAAGMLQLLRRVDGREKMDLSPLSLFSTI